MTSTSTSPDADALRPSRPARSRIAMEDALAPFEEALRQQLPSADEILRLAVGRRQTQRRTLTGAALGVALALLCWVDPAYKTEQIATTIGERGSWTAPDGSQIELNTGSHLRVSWHLRSRRLELLQGEATFHVAHAPWHGFAPGAERPFSVVAGDITVQDIGTVFNVRLRPEGVQVSVLEGGVRVMRADEAPRELRTGETLLGTAAPLPAPQMTDVAVTTAWRSGRLVLDHTPLAEAVAEMQRYRTAPIILREGPVAALQLSGQFDLDHIDQLIGLLPTLAPVRVTRASDGTVRIDPRDNTID